MKAKKYIKSTASLVAIKKYFNVKVIASIVASLMLLYAPVALYDYTKENGTLLYNVAEAQITSTVPIAKGTIKTEAVVEETSSYSVNNGFEEALENGVGTYTNSDNYNNGYQNSRPSSTPTTNNQQNNSQSTNGQGNNSQNNNEVSKDLSFLKGSSISMVEGDSFDPMVNLGIVAHDKDGTDITDRVSIDENTVDVNNEGSYYVKASVKLNDGSILEKTFTVKVNPKKEITYEVNNFEMLENTAPKLGTARIFFNSKISDDTVFPLKATINGVKYNVNTYGKSGFGGSTRHYIDVNVGDISGEFKLDVEKIEFSNGVSVWPNKRMSVYVIKSEPVVSNFGYTEDEKGNISTTFDLKDLDNSLSNVKVSLYNEKGILIQEHKVEKKEKYNLDFSVEANGKYTLEVIGDVNLYNDLNKLNQSRVILSENIQVSKIIDKSEIPVVDNSKLDANDVQISVGEELNIGDMNIVALDKNGEDISGKVEIDTSKLDITNAGEYEVLLTVVNSDNTKFEKVVKVSVTDDEFINSSTFSKTRSEILESKEVDDINDKQVNQEYSSSNIPKAREIFNSSISNPISADLLISGNVDDSLGNSSEGRIEVELPSNISFTVDQYGNFKAPTNFNINNNSAHTVEISIEAFLEQKPLGGIKVLKEDVSESDARNVINLEMEGNMGKTRLYSNKFVPMKISEIEPNKTTTVVLRGTAGKAKQQDIDSNGINELFTVKFKINKKD